MEKTTQKLLRALVASGAANEVTADNAPAPGYQRIAYAAGVYGLNGLLLKDTAGQLWAICSRNSYLYIYG